MASYNGANTQAAAAGDPQPAARAGRERAQFLDRIAGEACRAGNHGQALRWLGLARAADPSMAPVLDEHRARVSASRLAAEAGQPPRPLAEVVLARLTDAGIAADDPGLARIAEHNGQALARGGAHPAPSQPELEPERFTQQVLDAAAELEAGQ
jgi:hypothetical protein